MANARAWALKEQARDLYRFDHEPGTARQLLKAWITARLVIGAQ